MRFGIIAWLLGVVLCITVARATTVMPTPTFEEMQQSAAFIGIVEVVDVPEEPKDGFHGDKPPAVHVKIIEAWKEAPKDWSGAYLWDDDFRPDKIASFNSWMPLNKPADIHIKFPAIGERFVVFGEPFRDGTLRDIYRWKRTPIVQKLPADHPDQKMTDWWGSLVKHCVRTDPLRGVRYSRNVYGRQRFVYRSEPDDPRTQACLRGMDITEPGSYWVIASQSATLMKVVAIEPNPDWPVHHTVKRGDTLRSIAVKYYVDPDRWNDIAKANNISGPTKLRAGTVLLIPEVPDMP